MKVKIDFKGFFVRHWLLILAVIAIIVVIFAVSSSQNAYMRAELAEMKGKVDTLQAGIEKKQKEIEGISAVLAKIDANLAHIDTEITAGEEKYNDIISGLGNLKAQINPAVIHFDNLEACKESFESLQQKFSLAITALDLKENNFNLCIDKTELQMDKIKNLETNIELQKEISDGYKAQYDAANQTIQSLKKTWKWKTIGGNLADAAMIAGTAKFMMKKKWKEALGVVVLRYVVGKLVLKI